jgi:hypothetical protein
MASKGKGKSGGARVITYVQVVHHSVYLLAIYDKSEQAPIQDNDLKKLLKLIPQIRFAQWIGYIDTLSTHYFNL